MKKLLVLYIFHEYNDRVEYFLKNAVFYDPQVDFYFISNDPQYSFESNHYIPKYVKTLKRENIGYDFGGWSEAILNNDLATKYEYYLFVNSSVIGPFLPFSYKQRWTDKYLEGLKNNVKLFGSTINTVGYYDITIPNFSDFTSVYDPKKMSHVQSYIFIIDQETLHYLINCEIFSTTNIAKSFPEAICLKEINMSRKIIEKGWNIGSLMKYYEGVDFTFQSKNPEDYSFPFLQDVMYDRSRDNIWKDEELVFIKGNRFHIRCLSNNKIVFT